MNQFTDIGDETSTISGTPIVTENVNDIFGSTKEVKGNVIQVYVCQFLSKPDYDETENELVLYVCLVFENYYILPRVFRNEFLQFNVIILCNGISTLKNILIVPLSRFNQHYKSKYHFTVKKNSPR